MAAAVLALWLALGLVGYWTWAIFLNELGELGAENVFKGPALLLDVVLILFFISIEQ